MNTIKINKANESKIIDKWAGAGLIADDVKNKRNVAIALEATLGQLLSYTPIDKNIEVWAFPIMYRIFKDTEEDMTYSEIRKKVSDVINNMEEDFKNILQPLLEYSMTGMDAEAEACAVFAENNKF